MTLLVCKALILINSSNLPWIPHDFEVSGNASKRCGEIYKNSPCLVKFSKIGYNRYLAICGSPKE